MKPFSELFFQRDVNDMYDSLEVLARVCCRAPRNSPLAVNCETVLVPSMQRFTVQTLHSKPYIISIVSYGTIGASN